MKPTLSHYQYGLINAIIVAILLWVPFAAFLTVWSSSGIGHYTFLRLLEDGVVLVGLLSIIPIIWRDNKLWLGLKRQQVLWLILAYTVLEIVIGLVALARHDVNAKALSYGLIVNLRFLGFFIVCLIAASRSNWFQQHWKWLVLLPAAVVVVFGILQYLVLPYNFLSHFGYSLATIPVYETINHNVHYIRIESTLRGANPLGAYLVVVTSLLVALLLKSKKTKMKVIYSLFLLASLLALFFTFSRSAWIGALLGIAAVVWLSIRSNRLKLWIGIGALVFVLICGLTLLFLRNNQTLQNDIFHTSKNSTITTTSDMAHESALRSGIHDVLHQPLGRGPGTAGPASVYNLAPARIAENYFIQVGQEVGWLGLVLFVLINWLVAKGLWLFKDDPLALGLLASLLGVTIVNFFSHGWTDNTLAYIWWGLAGLCLSPVLKSKQVKQTKQESKNAR